MKAIYSPIKADASHGNCGYCLTALSKNESVAHSGEGYKHAIHLACIKILASEGFTRCLYCNVETSFDPTENSWKNLGDRILKDAMIDIIYGIGTGIFVYFGLTSLGDESSRKVAFIQAGAICLGFGSASLINRLEERGYRNTAWTILAGIAVSGMAGLYPSLIGSLTSVFSIINYGTPYAYNAVSGLTVASGIALTSGMVVGLVAGSAYEIDFQIQKVILGRLGAAFGAATSAIALGLVGLDLENRLDAIWDEKLPWLVNEAARKALILSAIGFTVTAVTIGAVVGGLLGRRFARL